MTDTLHGRIQDLDVTLWIGKRGLDPVVDELAAQLEERDLVKVKFLRSARGSMDVEGLATELAERVDAEVVDIRGNTAVVR
jgi:RNA-binding protein